MIITILRNEDETTYIYEPTRRGRPLSPNPKSKRAEYQRNLMRDKRARDKAAKESKP